MKLNVKQLKKRGLITLPPAIKKYLNLLEGDFITFYIKDDGSVELKKLEFSEKNKEKK